MRIRDFQEDDLEPLFEMQRDPESRWMAGFGSKDFDDKEAFLRHMSKISKDEDSIFKVVEHELQVVGNVGKFGFSKYEEVLSFSDIRNMEILEIGFVLD